MKSYYLIHEKVGFDPATYRIWPMSNPGAEISLYAPASQCLLILIQQPGKIFSQQFLFEEIWEQNGQYASANTLYQNIAILRKSLRASGIEEDIIITVPRQGLKFVGHVREVIAEEFRGTHEPEVGNASLDESTAREIQGQHGLAESPSQPQDSPTETRPVNSHSDSVHSIKPLIVPVFLILLTLTSVGYEIFHSYYNQNSLFNKYNYIGDVNGCYLYSTYEGVAVSEATFKSLLGRVGLTCSLRTTAYITLDKNYHATSVLKCDKDIRDSNADCKTFIFRNNSR